MKISSFYVKLIVEPFLAFKMFLIKKFCKLFSGLLVIARYFDIIPNALRTETNQNKFVNLIAKVRASPGMSYNATNSSELFALSEILGVYELTLEYYAYEGNFQH